MGVEKEKIIIESTDAQFDEGPAKETLRILAFTLDKENYCIEITNAKEVFTPGLITFVPNAPGFLRGVTNLHGTIIPLIDLRPLLGLAAGEVSQSSKVIVAEVKDGLVGIIVDRIYAASKIEKELIQPPLATLQGKILEYTVGQVRLEAGIMALLDLKKILGSVEFKNSGG